MARGGRSCLLAQCAVGFFPAKPVSNANRTNEKKIRTNNLMQLFRVSDLFMALTINARGKKRKQRASNFALKTTLPSAECVYSAHKCRTLASMWIELKQKAQWNVSESETFPLLQVIKAIFFLGLLPNAIRTDDWSCCSYRTLYRYKIRRIVTVYLTEVVWHMKYNTGTGRHQLN